jgi:hypothetical protein
MIVSNIGLMLNFKKRKDKKLSYNVQHAEIKLMHLLLVQLHQDD